MVTKTKVFLCDSQGKKPLITCLSPVLEPFCLSSGLAEELKLHLLELSCTDSEVSGCDLVTERLTDLADTERHFLSGCTLNVLEVYEDTLSCLGTKVNHVLCVLCNTLESLKHKVKLSDSGEVVLTA